MKNKLDIIIPVFNEEKIILELLSNLFKSITCEFRILICYDYDEDPTLKEISNSNIDNQKYIFIKNESSGPNKAILTGIKNSNAEIVLVYMVDDLINIPLINKMVNLIDNGYDLIIPSRFVSGGTFENKNIFKKIITIFGYAAMYYVAGIPFKDCTNAFKMFSSKILKNINLKSSKGFTYALELTIKAHHLKYHITELPAKWKEIEGRKSNFKVVSWLPYYIYWLFYAILLRLKII